MGLFSMVIQPLSMVTHHNDQRALLKFRFLEKVEQASHLLVGVSNFTRVRILGVTALKWLGRIIGVVGIVIVDP